MTVDERRPAVMMVMTPRGPASRTRTSQILEESEELFERYTGLALASVEQAGIQSSALGNCPREIQLGCWAGQILDVYASRSGERENARKPALLVVVSVVANAKGGDRITSLVIDLERAGEIEKELPAELTQRNARRENALFDTAVDSVSGTVATGDETGLKTYLTKLVTRGIRSRLERLGEWQPFATLKIEGKEGFLLSVDGHLLGRLSAKVTTVKGLRPGQRILEITDAEQRYFPVKENLHLKVGEVNLVKITLVRKMTEHVNLARRTLVWTGVGTTLLGAGVLGFAQFATQTSKTVKPCKGASCTGSPGTSFSRFCDYQNEGDCTGAGDIRVAPLGYSLMITGLSLSGSGIWADESGHFRWWGPLLGFGLGALSYGISLQAETE